MPDPRPLESFSEENRTWVSALRDSDLAIRWHAVESVADIVDDELAAELLQVVESPGDEELRGAAAIALGPSLELCDDELDEHGDLPDADDPYNTAPVTTAAYRSILETLRRVYADGSVPALVRRRVLEASVRSPQPWHDGAVRAAWASNEELWRGTAVFCMGFLYRTKFDAEVAEALLCQSVAIRREAVWAIGRRGLVEHGARIKEIAASRSQDRELRLAAIQALGCLEVSGAEELLARLARDRDPEIAEAAQDAQEERCLLEESDDPELSDELGLTADGLGLTADEVGLTADWSDFAGPADKLELDDDELNGDELYGEDLAGEPGEDLLDEDLPKDLGGHSDEDPEDEA